MVPRGKSLKLHSHGEHLGRSRPDQASESVRVIQAAADISGNIEQASHWYKSSPVQSFNYKTPEDIVSEGRADDLIRYIQSLHAGFAG